MPFPVRIILILLLATVLVSCKKCITCTALDSSTNEIKFKETSCAKGPLLDDWVELIEESYPSPAYITECK